MLSSTFLFAWAGISAIVSVASGTSMGIDMVDVKRYKSQGKSRPPITNASFAKAKADLRKSRIIFAICFASFLASLSTGLVQMNREREQRAKHRTEQIQSMINALNAHIEHEVDRRVNELQQNQK